MKYSSPRAFTLIEMLTVMAVIAILASLIVAVNGFAHKKAGLTRADGEIHALSAACESYKADMGAYPRDKPDGSQVITDKLDPRVDLDPSSSLYADSSKVLYEALSGDEDGDGKMDVDGENKPKSKSYFEFKPTLLRKDSSGKIKNVQDPFGLSYGYSTAGAAAEEKFRAALEKDPDATRPKQAGFNPTFDLWSTGGVLSGGAATADDVRKRWVKNW